jgi:hypothetical protein
VRYIFERGRSKRRVMHLCGYDRMTGEPTLQPLCGMDRVRFDTSINLPMGKRVCKACRRALSGDSQ